MGRSDARPRTGRAPRIGTRIEVAFCMRRSGMRRRLELVGYVLGAAASAVLVGGSLLHRLPMDITEVLGFVTGAWSVWLTVKENIWNWPIGVANSAFYVIVFAHARLFADSGLNALYVILGLLGWYWWLRGGENRGVLHVGRTSVTAGAVLLALGVLATLGMTRFLTSVNDSAPFLDALTTVLSLIAEFMLARKLLENWYFWMTADVIYIGLYTYRSLYLTSVLYVIFLTMCVAGWWRWSAVLRLGRAEIAPEPIRA
ncbi:MAG: nicotinamide mononucleotide transporter [Chloroflexi bacterium]|nr:MAG: nicotinamide mononucleotide transporter [Chloroflexota bacterium]